MYPGGHAGPKPDGQIVFALFWRGQFHAIWPNLSRPRARAEIVSLRTVSARVDAWLALHVGELPARGHWRDLAEEISVAPEALYRELARRR